MVVMAASAKVSNVVGMIGTEAGLSVETAAIKLQWCASPINVLHTGYQPFSVIVFFLLASISSTRQMRRSSRRAYIYLLGVQCLVSLSDGLAGYTFPLYNTLAVQKPPAVSTEPVGAPAGPLDPSTLPETEPAFAGLRTVRAGWPALLAAPSFLLTSNLSDPIFGDVLDALQMLACVAGCLTLPTT
jgi:hypothetical protein